ncbi:CEP89 [Bugula neritina]|uniref:CEP89 n=1 Tax=Bugula neritina TaxID=10212 RepID=A0A7J7KES2_BUGNE|nr:CEP89 [Bugula neritina]
MPTGTVDREEHNRALMEYRAKLERAKEDQERDKESFLLKLSQVEFEREECEERQSELKDELREAKHEIKNKVKCIVSLEEDCAALTREVKQGKDVVAKLLLVTDEAVHERQSMKHFLKSEKTNKKKSVGAIVESELMKEKVVESFKKYKVKAEKEIDKLLAKLEKQAEEFDVERREYERQLKHLRLLVHEKDVQKQEAIRDKQDVDECLELVWKATQADNNDLNNSLRKSMRESRLKHLGNFWMNSSKTDVVRQAEQTIPNYFLALAGDSEADDDLSEADDPLLDLPLLLPSELALLLEELLDERAFDVFDAGRLVGPSLSDFEGDGLLLGGEALIGRLGLGLPLAILLGLGLPLAILLGLGLPLAILLGLGLPLGLRLRLLEPLDELAFLRLRIGDLEVLALRTGDLEVLVLRRGEGDLSLRRGDGDFLSSLS